MRSPAGWAAVYILAVILFLTVPVVVVVLSSFDAASYVQFPPSGLTLKWYAKALSGESTRLALENSLIVGVGSTALAVGLGVPASLTIARRRFPGRDAIYALVLSPITVPWVVFGLALLYLASASTLPRNLSWLIVGHAVMGIPYVIRTCVAALAGVSPAFELAARNLGASPLRAFVRITLPMMRTGIVAGATFCLLLSFINVPVPLFLTTSSTVTVQVAIFSYMLSNTDPGVAAIATIQLVIILVAFYAGQRIGNLREFVL